MQITSQSLMVLPTVIAGVASTLASGDFMVTADAAGVGTAVRLYSARYG
ncbi:MAG: hypothetical protein ACJZ9L_01390 [Coraliomargaritaceae bacterium]